MHCRMRSSLRTACDILCAYFDTLAGEPVHRDWIRLYLDVDLESLLTADTNTMADYFSEYSSFVGAKGLPSPADTPYDTPGFLRSKRSSRATTAGSTRSREQSASPPPLPPDAVEYADKNRDGRYTALDPRRFTPTLHASLVSEILSLRRELDSKNHLVENLETSLASAKNDNETLSAELTTSAKEVRTAKQQVAQMESGTYEALEALVKERDNANASLQEMKARLEATQKKTRGHDEEAERTQTIWEREKEQWENERRQLERRVHVTETRLRAFVDEVAAQQAASEAAPVEQESIGDNETIRDSGIGNDSETTSLASPRKRHTRNVSSLSFKNGFRNSVFSRAVDSPEPSAKPPGHSLADELGIDEEDEENLDESDHEDDEDDELDYHERPKHLQSRQGSMIDMDSKAKRILGLSDDLPVSPAMRDFPKDVSDETPVSPGLRPVSPQRSSSPQNHATAISKKVEYVDTGYQPSPPSSPAHGKRQLEPLQVPQQPRGTPTFLIDSGEPDDTHVPVRRPISVPAKLASSPISPPETPVVDGVTWPEGKKTPALSPIYSSASTQTEDAGLSLTTSDAPKRDSLQVPVAVPQIAIHPPTSRPSSPRTYALPPNTKNAGSQTNLRWPGKDASVQTEEIRIDQRPIKLPPHLLPSHLDELPEASVARKPAAEPAVAPKKPAKREAPRRQHISTNLPMLSSFPSPPMRSPTEVSSRAHSRDGSTGGLGKMPLKAISLPKPTLAPAISMDEVAAESSKGPLNRSSQFGVSQQSQANRQLAEIDDVSDISSSDDSEADDQAGSMPVLNAAGRLEGPDPLAFIPHDFANSPQRRPATADSYDAAPAPSIASSRNNSQRGVGGKRPPPSRSSAYLQTRARSPSFTSVASSNVSTQSALPPYAIPTRSSSRFSKSYFHSEDAQSPTPGTAASRGKRAARGNHQRQGSLRKVQSAASMRGRANKMSPQKPRRRRRSPALTPVQSMAFESPAPTNFPIPELPTPLQQSLAFDWGKRPSSPSKRPDTAASSAPPHEESQLVDSIAGTMVGEWMWKYMRKRKSFGAEAAETFSARNGEESNVGFTSHGTRHKRWVWLSPYERTIMWDSKQPSSASALQGKKGRKCESETF